MIEGEMVRKSRGLFWKPTAIILVAVTALGLTLCLATPAGATMAVTCATDSNGMGFVAGDCPPGSPPIVAYDSGYSATAAGAVYNEGQTGQLPGVSGHSLNAPIVGIAPTFVTNSGGAVVPAYWLAATDGGIFSFGGAPFYGSTGGEHLNAPIVGMAVTNDEKGYWLVASDGGVFAFGDAVFYGSMGGQHLDAPVVGMASTGTGYYLGGRDGGVFTFGSAAFQGSAVGAIRSPVIAVGAATSNTSPGGSTWVTILATASGELFGLP